MEDEQDYEVSNEIPRTGGIGSFFASFFGFFSVLRLPSFNVDLRKMLSKLHCQLHVIKDMYMFVGKSHLELTPYGGTFIKDTHRLRDIFPRITVVDSSYSRLKRVESTLSSSYCLVTSIMLDITKDVIRTDAKFDSIAMPFSLDIIEGLRYKDALIGDMRGLLNNGGTLFGVTVCGNMARHEKKAYEYIEAKNDKGDWFNIDTSVKDLENIFSKYFDRYSIDRAGSCLLFACFLDSPRANLDSARLTMNSVKGKHLKVNPKSFSKYLK